jgi:hypothetical protein
MIPYIMLGMWLTMNLDNWLGSESRFFHVFFFLSFFCMHRSLETAGSHHAEALATLSARGGDVVLGAVHDAIRRILVGTCCTPKHIQRCCGQAALIPTEY